MKPMDFVSVWNIIYHEPIRTVDKKCNSLYVNYIYFK